MGSNTPPDIDHSDEEFEIGDDYSWLLWAQGFEDEGDDDEER